jgi:hypothetical protein
MDWVDLVGGLDILALAFFIVSPDDDGSQQELISPATPSVRVSFHTKVGPRRSLAGSPINGFAAGDPILGLKTDRLVVVGQAFDRLTQFQAQIWIHSPPAISILHQVSAMSVLCLFGRILHGKSETPPFWCDRFREKEIEFGNGRKTFTATSSAPSRRGVLPRPPS